MESDFSCVVWKMACKNTMASGCRLRTCSSRTLYWAAHLSAEPVIANYFATRVDLENAVVVAPDAGDLKRASALARRLGLPLAFIDKERVSDTEVRVRMLVGEVEGKTALIVDDEISTAGSLVEAVEALMQAGAKEVYAAATHGVYVGPALDRIAKSPVKEVAATDTCPPKEGPKLRTLTVAPLFAEAIWRIHRGESVSSLFT